MVENWIIDPAARVRFPPKSWDFFQPNLLCFVLCYGFHVVRGGKVKGINRRGGGALFCDFVSTKWSAFILILIETILKGKNLQPLGANSFL